MINKIILSIIIIGFIPWAGCEKQENNTVDMGDALNPQRDFTLHDQDGRVFHLKDHRGQVILLFFGYTTCPDVCPTTLSKLARVYALLQNQNGPGHSILKSDQVRLPILKSDQVRLLTVFVTVDPQRDTPERLKSYLQYFSINAVGLTGTKQEIDAVVDSYKATYERVVVSASALGYMFNHTDYLYLIDSQGATVHLFHFDDKASDMAPIIKGYL